MRYMIDNLECSFISTSVKRTTMILAFIIGMTATIFVTGAAQAQDVSATIANVQRFASGTQPTQLLATVTLEDVRVDGRRLGRQRVTFSLTGTQRDVQLAIGIHEGDTVEQIDDQITPISLSTSGLRTYYISHINQSSLGSFASSFGESDRETVYSICKFLTVRRNISSILLLMMNENNVPKPPNYIPTRMFFESSTLNVTISELVFISNRCVDEITAPIRTTTAAASPRNDVPAQSPTTPNALGNEVLAAVPSLSDALRDIQSLIDNSVPLEAYTALNNELQSVQQELAALRRSTVPRSQYEQLQANTVSRQVHDRLSQQLSNLQNEIAELRRSTVSAEEHARVQQLLTQAEAELGRIREETTKNVEIPAPPQQSDELIIHSEVDYPENIIAPPTASNSNNNISLKISNGDLDFTNMRIENFTFSSSVSLRGADFTGAILENVEFDHTNLTMANLHGAQILHVRFLNANLVSTNFEGADIQFSSFMKTNLTEASFEQAMIHETIFYDQTKMDNANFIDSQIINTRFENIILDGAIFFSAQLEGSVFQDVRNSRSGVDFSSAEIVGTSFWNSELEQSRFIDSKILNNEFTESNFDRSYFDYSLICENNFSGSSFEWSYFENARGALNDFESSNLNFTNFNVATLEGTNFSSASISDANFEMARLNGANFSNTELNNTWFTRADLSSANFEGANLYQTSFAYAIVPKNLSDYDVSRAIVLNIRRQIVEYDASDIRYCD